MQALRLRHGESLFGLFSKPGQRRRLGKIQLLRALAEIAARRRLRAVEAVAEKDAVQIELEDFRLGKALLDFLRDEHFQQLATVAAVVARQLDRERNCARAAA